MFLHLSVSHSVHGGGGIYGKGVCMVAGGMHGRWVYVAGSAWQGVMLGRGMYGRADVHGRGHAWWGGMCGRGHVWQGDLQGRGVCGLEGMRDWRDGHCRRWYAS